MFCLPISGSTFPRTLGILVHVLIRQLASGGNKTAKKGREIKLDILPVDDSKVMNVTQSKLSVLTPGEDENVE